MIRLKQNSMQLPEGDPAQRVSVPGEALLQKRGAALWFTADGTAWAPLASGSGGGAAIVAATIAALGAVDVTGLSDGTKGSVLSLLDTWTLVAAAGAPDGITVIQAADGVRFWVRDGNPHIEWTTQATWFVSSAGNDENPGDVVGSPIRTIAELRRRLGKLPIRIFVQVNLLSNIAEDVVLDFQTDFQAGGAVMLVGTRTQVATEVITGATPHNNAAGARAYGQLAFGVDVSAHEGRLLVAEDGAAVGSTAWHVQDTAAGPTACYTGPFITAGNNETFPAIGDTIGFYDLSTIQSVAVAEECFCGIFDVRVTGTLSINGGMENSASLGRNRFDGEVYCGGQYPAAGSAAGGGGFDCQFSGALFRGYVTVLGGGSILTQVCQFTGRFAALEVKPGGHHACSLTTGFVGAPADEPVHLIAGTCDLNAGASIAYVRYTAGIDCMQVEGGGMVRALGNLWGRDITAGGAGNVLTARANSMITYDNANPPDFTANADVEVGGVAGLLGALPITTAANFSGIVVDV